MNANKLAAALRAAADAVEEGGATVLQAPDTAPVAAATPRGRGRPPKATTEAAAPAVAPAAPEADSFEETAPAAPIATQADVRAALTALAKVTDQATALKVLKDVGGADNLSGLAAAKYGDVVQAALKATPATKAAVVEDDPFATTETTAVQEDAPTLEQVKAAIVAAGTRTSQDTTQKLVMAHGGKAPKADGTGDGPSLKALPVPQYAAVIKALEALPTTK